MTIELLDTEGEETVEGNCRDRDRESVTATESGRHTSRDTRRRRPGKQVRRTSRPPQTMSHQPIILWVATRRQGGGGAESARTLTLTRRYRTHTPFNCQRRRLRIRDFSIVLSHGTGALVIFSSTAVRFIDRQFPPETVSKIYIETKRTVHTYTYRDKGKQAKKRNT